MSLLTISYNTWVPCPFLWLNLPHPIFILHSPSTLLFVKHAKLISIPGPSRVYFPLLPSLIPGYSFHCLLHIISVSAQISAPQREHPWPPLSLPISLPTLFPRQPSVPLQIFGGHSLIYLLLFPPLVSFPLSSRRGFRSQVTHMSFRPNAISGSLSCV